MSPNNDTTRIVSIVAQDPIYDITDHEPAPEEEPHWGQDEGDASIQAVMLQFQKHYNNSIHSIYRASSVRDIVRILRRDGDRHNHTAPQIIQIIGHGGPGMLSLGYRWKKPECSRERDPEDFYYLDSSPVTYGKLVGWVSPQKTKVLLLCCNVDKSARTDKAHGYIPDLETLAFVMSRMWKSTPVGVSQFLIDSDHFDPDGAYKFCKKLAFSDGIKVSDPEDRIPPPIPISVLSEGEKIDFHWLLDAPILGLDARARPGRSFPVSIQQNKALQNAFTTRVRVPSPLALPEFVFLVTWKNKHYKAEMLANGSLLRLHSRRKIHYFSGSTDLARIARPLLAQM